MKKALLGIGIGALGSLLMTPLFISHAQKAASHQHPAIMQSDICDNQNNCFSITSELIHKVASLPNEHYASLPRRYSTGGERTFVFDPRSKAWAAYDESGYRVSSGVANGGKPGHRTPAGVYRVHNKAGAGHVSSKYPKPHGGAPMPYAMHFTKSGHAVHGSPHISNQNGSHGCIRVKTSAAKWLNQNFIRHGTKIVVKSY